MQKHQSVQLEVARVNAQGFDEIMASEGSGAKRNRTLLDFNFIKKKMREDEENEQDGGQ